MTIKPTTFLTSALLLSSQLASAAALDFNDFSNTTGLQLNGAATVTGGILRLTPATNNQSGSVFSSDRIMLDANTSFSSMFQFRITNSGGNRDTDGIGADGLVFVMQTMSNTAGTIGGGMGYKGLSPSFGVEFDTWNNSGWDDNNGNHVGIDLNGDINSVTQVAVPTRMNNGNVWSAWVDYNSVSDSMEVRLIEGTEEARPEVALLSYTISSTALPITENGAFFGFTAGTGGAYGAHEILNWSLETHQVAEPTTLALLGIGFAGLAATRRRQLKTRSVAA
ncbi:PEP-CTERM sorting domain-containing protein [Rhodoferax sp. 4810]|uniref:PEP-CTERM sorting domain-containing protein n=1 Tax=Thiospirillum jenense TaxID=1653858 RepID=A0A839HFW9_9GAMM|nr:PEP-CTERM sorting domain-containing protein [Thiospirillum jenense]MBB1074177.1 PEP-CTERM sorting domain-containing protein [Rhodoferax jenense]MBB1125252.1 PEP-CTERM sorting domain-containing protein [Thiospirillum jenense]